MQINKKYIFKLQVNKQTKTLIIYAYKHTDFMFDKQIKIKNKTQNPWRLIKSNLNGKT